MEKAEEFTSIESCAEYLLKKIIPEEEIGTHSLTGKQPAVNKGKKSLPRIDVGKIARVRGNVYIYIVIKRSHRGKDVRLSRLSNFETDCTVHCVLIKTFIEDPHRSLNLIETFVVCQNLYRKKYSNNLKFSIL